MQYDAIVIGTGGMGSAACLELARRGRRVLGLDRFHPPHSHGGTHGRSRIIRQAYMEAPAYVPLLLSAYRLWRRLEEETGVDLLRITGGLMIGPPDSDAVAGSLRSAREHGIAHEMLDPAEIRRRFPPLTPGADTVALWEREAGVLDPELGVGTMLDAAEDLGAVLRPGVRVTGWECAGEGVRVRTENGEQLRAARLVLTAGPWASELLPGVSTHLTPSREVMHWFQPEGGVARYAPDRFPIYIWDPGAGAVIYGFPALDGPQGGVKVAIHHGGDPVDPDHVSREVTPDDVEAIRACLAHRIPDLAGRHLHGAVCLYTNSPDHHFLLGPHPQAPQVVLAAGLSGHGYKFAPVVGALLADLALHGETDHPIGPFLPPGGGSGAAIPG